MTSRHLPSWVPVSVVAGAGAIHAWAMRNEVVDWALLPIVPIVPAVLARRFPLVAGMLVWLITVPTFYVSELQPISLLLAACVRGGGTEGENSYTIYYPAAELRDVPGEDAIVARTVQLPDADTLTQEELAQRLLERLLADAPDAGVRAPMPGGTTLLSLSVLGNWARVDFSRQYARLAGIDLTLADYCVTLTLTQLDGVNAVSITSGGRELPYRETQTLTAADPLLSMREDALRPITVSLYFLDPTSGALRAEKRALALYEGQTRVNALLEALAQGPESGALAALLPEEFTVLSARVEEGTCYLNLPSDADLGISPRQTVESLVLSLCSLDTVERVQIVVDGEIAAQLNGVNVGEPLTP